MDRDTGPTRTIDYDRHKARALALREQAIDRLFARLVLWVHVRTQAVRAEVSKPVRPSLPRGERNPC